MNLQMTKLGEICEFINGDRGKNYPSGNDIVKEGVPFINAGHIQNNKINLEEMNYITEEKYNLLGSGKIKKGDIVYCLRGSLGKYGIISLEKGAIASSLVILRPNKCIVEPRFLMHYLGSTYIQKQIYKANNGSSQPNLSAQSVKNFDIYLPCLNIQIKIANILDQAQELIDKRKAQIEALDELIQSVFYDMFGDPILNTKQLKTKRVDEIVILQRGYDLPSKDRDNSGHIEVWGANGVLSKHSAYKVECGGIVTGRSGSIGNVYYTKEPFWPLNTTLFSKETYDNNIIYLCYLLRNFKIDRFVNGTGVPTLNRNLVHTEKIIAAPIELQNKFAEIVESIEKQKELLNESLVELENNFNSLVQRAFKGELF